MSFERITSTTTPNRKLNVSIEQLKERLSDHDFILHEPNDFYIQDELADDVDIARNEEDYDDMDIPETMEADDIDDEITDKYLNAELIFDVGTGSERKGRVVKRAKGTSGEPNWSSSR